MPDIRDELKELISALPVVDGAFNHRAAPASMRPTEDQITGLIKAVKVNQLLHDAAHADAAKARKAAIAAVQLVTSPDASEIATTRAAAERLGALRVDAPTRALLTKLSAAYDAKSGALNMPEAEFAGLHAQMQAAERANTYAVRDLASVVDVPMEVAPGRLDTLRHFAQEAKRYEINDDGHLYNLSSARNGLMPGAPSHADSIKAFNNPAFNNELQKKADYLDLTLQQLTKAGGKAPKEIFDIGPADGVHSQAAVELVARYGGGMANVHYHAIDLNPKFVEQTAARFAPLPLAEKEIIHGTLGETKDAKMQKQTDEKLKPLEGKIDFVYGSHVYNLGDVKKFFAQVGTLGKAGSVTHMIHEEPESDTTRLKRSFPKLFRPSGKGVTEGISEELKRSGTKEFSFTTKATLEVPRISDEEWQLFKGMETGKFSEKIYRATDAEQKSFEEKRALVEFILASPLPSFEKQDRAQVLDALKDMLEKQDYKLALVSKSQMFANKGLGRAQDIAAARETEAVLEKTVVGVTKQLAAEPGKQSQAPAAEAPAQANAPFVAALASAMANPQPQPALYDPVAIQQRVVQMEATYGAPATPTPVEFAAPAPAYAPGQPVRNLIRRLR